MIAGFSPVRRSAAGVPLRAAFIVITLSRALLPGQLPAQARGQSAGPERIYSLEEALARLAPGIGQAHLRWDPFFTRGVLVLEEHRAAFDAGQAGETVTVIFDSKDVFSLPAPFLENGVLRFPEAFVRTLGLAFESRIEEDRSRLRIAAVIIDPGHGGKDPGALGTHQVNGRQVEYQEKTITLEAGLVLYRLLHAAYPEKRILLTRNGDTYPSLDDRVNLANAVPLRNNEAIVYVSLHANASIRENANGFEVFYLNSGIRRDLIGDGEFQGNSDIRAILNDMRQDQFITESIMIAQAIDRRISAAMGRSLPSRGIKPADWFVVRNARMPSVLIELGFITNARDAALMTGEASLQKLVNAIYNGIADFIGAFENSGGFTLNQ